MRPTPSQHTHKEPSFAMSIGQLSIWFAPPPCRRPGCRTPSSRRCFGAAGSVAPGALGGRRSEWSGAEHWQASGRIGCPAHIAELQRVRLSWRALSDEQRLVYKQRAAAEDSARGEARQAGTASAFDQLGVRGQRRQNLMRDVAKRAQKSIAEHKAWGVGLRLWCHNSAVAPKFIRDDAQDRIEDLLAVSPGASCLARSLNCRARPWALESPGACSMQACMCSNTVRYQNQLCISVFACRQCVCHSQKNDLNVGEKKGFLRGARKWPAYEVTTSEALFPRLPDPSCESFQKSAGGSAWERKPGCPCHPANA